MELKSKVLIVALASALPWMSANAQTQAELQKEIAALRTQLQALQQKVEALNAAPAAPVTNVAQQVNRLEQRLDLADDESEKTGFKGMKINGTIEAGFGYDSQVGSNNFSASSGSATDSREYSGYAMVQISKDTQGEGVDWTLRMLPGADAANLIHEASLSIPLDSENRLIGGVLPDFQGYEFVFPNANPTLGNQLISHNALYDVAGATQYTGIGMNHTLGGGDYGFKWLLGNVDVGNDDAYDVSYDAATNATTSTKRAYNNHSGARSVALAYRADWFINEFSYIGLSGLHGSVNRNFRIMAVDGGYTHGDWQFNGQLSSGWMRNAAVNGDDAEWTGISALMGYKATPRLQLLARADYIYNRKNGGGTYVYPGGGAGLGQEKDVDGNLLTDDDGVTPIGASLTRLTFGTNYQINQNTQWKVEYLLDTSSGYNFTQSDGTTPTRQRSRLGTALVLSF